MAASSSSAAGPGGIDPELSVILDGFHEGSERVKEMFPNLTCVNGTVTQATSGLWSGLKNKVRSGTKIQRVITVLNNQSKIQAQRFTEMQITKEEPTTEEINKTLEILRITKAITDTYEMAYASKLTHNHEIKDSLFTALDNKHLGVRRRITEAFPKVSDELIMEMCTVLEQVRKLEKLGMNECSYGAVSSFKRVKNWSTQLIAEAMLRNLPRDRIDHAHCGLAQILINRYIEEKIQFDNPSSTALFLLENREEFFSKCLAYNLRNRVIGIDNGFKGFIYFAIITQSTAARRALENYRPSLEGLPIFREYERFKESFHQTLKSEARLEEIQSMELDPREKIHLLEELHEKVNISRHQLAELGNAFRQIPEESRFGQDYHGCVSLMNKISQNIHDLQDEEFGKIGKFVRGEKNIIGALEDTAFPDRTKHHIQQTAPLLKDKQLYLAVGIHPDDTLHLLKRDTHTYIIQCNPEADSFQIVFQNPVGNISRIDIGTGKAIDKKTLLILLGLAPLPKGRRPVRARGRAADAGAASSSTARAHFPITSIIEQAQHLTLSKEPGTIWAEILNDLEQYAVHFGWPYRDKTIRLTPEIRGSLQRIRESEAGSITLPERLIDANKYSYIYAQLLAASAIEEYRPKICDLDNRQNYNENRAAQLLFALTGLATHSGTNNLTSMVSHDMNFVWLLQQSYKVAKERGELLNWFGTAFEGACFEDRYRNLQTYYHDHLYIPEDVKTDEPTDTAAKAAGAFLFKDDSLNDIVMKCLTPFQKTLVEQLGLKEAPGKPGDAKYEEYEAIFTEDNFIDYVKKQLDLCGLDKAKFDDAKLKEEVENLYIF